MNISTHFLMVSLLLSAPTFAQNGSDQFKEFIGHTKADTRREFKVPNITGYKTLKADFHVHTFYTDGQLTPEERVREAWRDGLDVIAITDHNWNQTINTAYDRAAKTAAEYGINLIKAVEYTDSKPIGHINFLFVEDPNSYWGKNLKPDAAIEKAAKEGAFIIYNHPGWPDKNSSLSDFHKKHLAAKRIHAMEVFNAAEFYPVVIDYCKEYKLAPVGASDIHASSEKLYNTEREFRPTTFVFAKENTLESLKEAVKAQRTIAYAYNNLAGDEKLLREFVLSALDIEIVNKKEDKAVYLIKNNSSISFTLQNPDQFHINLPAGKTARISISNKNLTDKYDLLNCHTSSKGNLQLSFTDLISKL